jgi:hypothetical protein
MDSNAKAATLEWSKINQNQFSQPIFQPIRINKNTHEFMIFKTAHDFEKFSPRTKYLTFAYFDLSSAALNFEFPVSTEFYYEISTDV